MTKKINFTIATSLSILFVLSITIYLNAIILTFPLIGIKVEQNDNKDWIIVSIKEHAWAFNQQIEVGDEVEFINGLAPEKHTSISRYKKVEMADSITVRGKDSTSNTFIIAESHKDNHNIIYLIAPIIFNLLTIALSLFVLLNAKNDKSSTILILFLLVLGLSYLSSFVSRRGDLAGVIIITVFLPITLILFMHFLKAYLLRFGFVFIGKKQLITLYCSSFIVVLIFLGLRIYVQQFGTCKYVMVFVSLLALYFIFFFTKMCMKYRGLNRSGIFKILGITMFLSFGPYILFFVIPKVLSIKEFIPGEVVAIFFIIIPFVFVYLQLSRLLLDIDFFLNRIRYYALISIPFAVFFIVVLSFVLQFELFTGRTAVSFSILYVMTTLFLYIKEYIDYKLRRNLFSQQNDYEASLYKFFQKAKYETKVTSLITNLMNEIREVLGIKQVFHIKVSVGENKWRWAIDNESQLPELLRDNIESIAWSDYRIGNLIEVIDRYAIIIGGDITHKSIIVFGKKKSEVKLNIQEIIWLEMLAYVSSILLENFQLIEGLFKKIKEYEVKSELENESQPFWLSRLLFSISEKERTNLSIDLHDSVLQEQLQLLREVEKIKSKVTEQTIKKDLSALKESMLDNIHAIRETCNELRPPFLRELGIIQSIQNLLEQTRLRCNFTLLAELDTSIKSLNPDYELALFRVVQELLSNAMNHSFANEVKITLEMHNQILFLAYTDNGIGIDMAKLNHSFQTIGLLGMKERVKSIGGKIEINSGQGKGMEVLIEINTGGLSDD